MLYVPLVHRYFLIALRTDVRKYQLDRTLPFRFQLRLHSFQSVETGHCEWGAVTSRVSLVQLSLGSETDALEQISILCKIFTSQNALYYSWTNLSHTLLIM